MTKFEMDPSKLVINDVDLSAYGLEWEPLPDGRDYSQKIAGLKGFSHAITFDNALTDEQVLNFAGVFQDDGGGYTWSSRATTPVKYETPDGKWQAFKHRLKRRLPRLFRRLKVRYITFSFDAALSSEMSWNGSFSISGSAVGPMSKGTETR